MGASVGIGGLIVGTTMLVVLALTMHTMTTQLESSLEAIEEAEEPLPSFTIDTAEVWEGAVVDVTITSGGSGYVDGTLVASSGLGGFSASFTTTGGVIDSVVITSHGNYSSAPTLVAQGQTPTTAATFSLTLGNVIHTNLTNSGSKIISNRDVWLFADGSNPTNLGSVYSLSPTSPHWFSGETIHVEWVEGSSLPVSRLAVSTDGVNVGSALA